MHIKIVFYKDNYFYSRKVKYKGLTLTLRVHNSLNPSLVRVVWSLVLHKITIYLDMYNLVLFVIEYYL